MTWAEEQVGRRFKGWDGRVYLCESHEPRFGFWMVAEGEPPRRTNISERAIGRTFHEIQEARQ